MYLNVSIILIALFLGECQIASIFFRGFTFFLWCANIFCYVWVLFGKSTLRKIAYFLVLCEKRASHHTEIWYSNEIKNPKLKCATSVHWNSFFYHIQTNWGSGVASFTLQPSRSQTDSLGPNLFQTLCFLSAVPVQTPRQKERSGSLAFCQKLSLGFGDDHCQPFFLPWKPRSLSDRR